MIQRIQTVYLFIAAVLSAVCLAMPVGVYVPEEMGVRSEMYNMYILTSDTAHEYDFSVCGLSFALVASCALSLIAIFKYKNRRAQSGMCLLSILLLAVWYVVYAVYALTSGDSRGAAFAVRLPAVLPAVSLIFNMLARRSILKDEALVRAADRIR